MDPAEAARAAALHLSRPPTLKSDVARSVPGLGLHRDIGSTGYVDVSIPANAPSGTLARLLGARRTGCGTASRDAPRCTRFRGAPRPYTPARRYRYRVVGATRSGEAFGDLLTQARELADCDAGSLYLIEEIAGVRSLHFKLAQNDTANVPFKEARLPLTTDSLSRIRRTDRQ